MCIDEKLKCSYALEFEPSKQSKKEYLTGLGQALSYLQKHMYSGLIVPTLSDDGFLIANFIADTLKADEFKKVGIRFTLIKQFTLTIIEDDAEIMRPELDHYFPKAEYPMFALSIYNLIPSCHGCNSTVKGIRKTNLAEHFHPYIDEDKKFSFKYEIEEGEDTFKTDIKFEYGGSFKAKKI